VVYEPPDRPGARVIGRVIGLADNVMEIADGRILANGVPERPFWKPLDGRDVEPVQAP
jgi:hypothetical protein